MPTLQQPRGAVRHIFDEHLPPPIYDEAVQRRLLFIPGDRNARLVDTALSVLVELDRVSVRVLQEEPVIAFSAQLAQCRIPLHWNAGTLTNPRTPQSHIGTPLEPLGHRARSATLFQQRSSSPRSLRFAIRGSWELSVGRARPCVLVSCQFARFVALCSLATDSESC